MKTSSSIRLTGRILVGILTVTLVTISLKSQGAGDPVVLRPQKGLEGQAVSLRRGEVLLFEVLQRFANYTGETVCFGSDDPPQTTVKLEQAVEKVDLKTARSLLEAGGYEVSQETYRGKKVYWVQRAIVPPGGKGRILRPGKGAPAGDTRTATSRGPTPTGPRSSIRLLRMEEGGGPRYMVILETDSRKDAENAMSLLEARRGLGDD